VPDEERESSGPSLSWVLGAAATVTLMMGVLAYKRYAESEIWVAEGIARMSEVGKDLEEREACIDEVLHWHERCTEHGGNGAVCLEGVKLVTFHCLQARERECEDFVEPQMDWRGKLDLGAWVYDRCIERGTTCKIKRECACAEAYRSLQSFCKTGQEAVQL